MLTEWQERMGVGRPHYGLARLGQTRQRVVIGDDGPNKGRPAAIQTDHKSGRVDAKVLASKPVWVNPLIGRSKP